MAFSHELNMLVIWFGATVEFYQIKSNGKFGEKAHTVDAANAGFFHD